MRLIDRIIFLERSSWRKSENTLAIRLLGRFEVSLGKKPLSSQDWPYRKVQTLFKILASEPGRIFTKDQLVEWLFPNRDPHVAIRNVQKRISELRRTLEPQLKRGQDSKFILRSGDGYCFNRDSSYWLDLEAFQEQWKVGCNLKQADCWSEALDNFRNAVDLYRDDYLPEDLYEEWSFQHRERIRELHIAVLEETAECHAHLSQYRDAIEMCRRALSADGYHESIYRQLIRYYAYLNEPSQALQVYHKCQHALEQLGLEPASETQELIEQIQTQGTSSISASKLLISKEGKRSDSNVKRAIITVGERRPLTVLICQLRVEDEPLQAAELLNVIHAYRDICVPIVRRFDGTIAQYRHSRFMVYFGFPQAHEDDAIRAVYAGLAIVRALRKLKQDLTEEGKLSLDGRVAIHTDLVEIKGAGENGVTGLSSVLDIAPHSVSCMVELAETGKLTISENTHKLARGFFRCRDLGTHRIEDIDGSVQIYQVLEKTDLRTRFDASMARGLTPLVAREMEMQLMSDSWELATEGKGQVLFLGGEAGIGKSRLALEFQRQHLKGPIAQLHCHGSPYHSHSALHPLVNLVQQLLHLELGESSSIQLHTLEEALSAFPVDLNEAVPLFGSLLSIPTGDRYPPLTATPELQKSKLMEMIITMLVEATEQGPILVLFEDLHWFDPSTLDFVGSFLEQVPASRLLAILTFRHDQFQPPWSVKSHMIYVTLGRLSLERTIELVKRVAGKELPAITAKQIATRADGVPLYAEELTMMIRGSELVRELGEDLEFPGGQPHIVPETLRGFLIARLDRLNGGKKLAQLAATFGKEFSYEQLRAVMLQEEELLQIYLSQLIDAELIYRRGFPPRSTYLFKHTLIQEAIYESIPNSTRKRFHQQIARELENQLESSGGAKLELIAHHYTEAALLDKAIPYWLEAGQNAVQHAANKEGIALLNKGLTLISTLPQSSDRDQLELDFQMKLVGPLQSIKGYASREVQNTFNRAHRLCDRLGKTPERFWTLCSLGCFCNSVPQHKRAGHLAEKMLKLAHELDDTFLVVMSNMMLGYNRLSVGRFQKAARHLKQSIELYDPEHHSQQAMEYEHEPGLSSHLWLAMTLWMQGYPDQADWYGKKAIAIAEDFNHSYLLVIAYSCMAFTHVWRNESEIARALGEKSDPVAQECGYLPFQGLSEFCIGWARVADGEVENGITQMHQGMDGWRASGSENGSPRMLATLAESYGKLGNSEKGMEILNEAKTLAEKTGEIAHIADMYRIQGDLLIGCATDGEIEKCYQQGLQIARKQQAKSLELRNAISLSRFWSSHGRKEEARQLLADVFGWFSEGFETPDLKRAASLLDQLS